MAKCEVSQRDRKVNERRRENVCGLVVCERASRNSFKEYVVADEGEERRVRVFVEGGEMEESVGVEEREDVGEEEGLEYFMACDAESGP